MKGPKLIVNAINTAGNAEQEALRFSVYSYLRRNKQDSPTNYGRRLRVGEFALKKRTVFPTGAPKKLCHKVRLDGFQISQTVFHVTSHSIPLQMSHPTFNSPNFTYDLDLSSNLLTQLLTQHLKKALTQTQHLTQPLTQLA